MFLLLCFSAATVWFGLKDGGCASADRGLGVVSWDLNPSVYWLSAVKRASFVGEFTRGLHGVCSSMVISSRARGHRQLLNHNRELAKLTQPLAARQQSSCCLSLWASCGHFWSFSVFTSGFFLLFCCVCLRLTVKEPWRVVELAETVSAASARLPCFRLFLRTSIRFTFWLLLSRAGSNGWAYTRRRRKPSRRVSKAKLACSEASWQSDGEVKYLKLLRSPGSPERCGAWNMLQRASRH